MTEEIIDYKKECSNLLAHKNALQCGYDELHERWELLKQENEKLHALLNSSPQVSAKLKKENDRLEQENKELKGELEKIYRLSDIAYDKILNLTEVSYGLNEIIDIQKIIKNDKTIYYDISTCDEERYRSALEEIREKVKNPITLSCFASAKFVLEQIYNKINEVLYEQ